MKNYDLEALNEVKELIDEDRTDNKEKIETIVSRLFIELTDEQKINLLYDEGDDFDFYLKFIKEIDFDFYDNECITDMTELILKKFIGMKTFASDDLIKLCKMVVIQNG